ncbi:BolA family protein [Algiphilus sp.]|uniref:BolA family protein n=1 Tax=Algiphilus sp. TaxID=1872431 RepID=UPI003C556CED
MSAPPDNRERITRMDAVLRDAFAPDSLRVEDESHLHVGHAGARSGRGHFRVHIVSAAFRGQAPLARHRAVYAALGTMMETDIHALAIHARTPDEAAERGD